MIDTFFSYGIIEGFFGKPWSWEAREAYASFLKENGFGFYIYAPKNDRYLRSEWKKHWDDHHIKKLEKMAAVYRQKNLFWGLGFTPYEIYLSYDENTKLLLRDKIRLFNELDPDILCILFDDMKGDVPDLARLQADIFHEIKLASTARYFIFCPSYYSFDPVLEKVFGKMPANYISDIGRIIDSQAHIFWTGDKVCSSGYTESHLKEVADILGRKPFIWDNYPVNDGAKKSRFIHLRPFENRPHLMCEWTSGHAVNPMNQAWLSMIPVKTLGESYSLKERYSPDDALIHSLTELCGNECAHCLLEDLSVFNDTGLDGMDEKQKQLLIKKYEKFRNPYSAEIIDWLTGIYEFDPACLTG